MIEEIQQRLHLAIAEKVFPGAVVGIIKKQEGQVVVPAGNFTYKLDSPAVTEQSVFDVASVTKSIPTSSLALWLIVQGKISVDDKIVNYIPELSNLYKDQITIRHLLTHTIIFDIPPLTSFKDKSPDEILQVLFSAELKTKPGEKYVYTNAPSILLGLVIERVSGKPLDVLADEIFFKPLGMNSTTFHPEMLDKDNIVPTEYDDWRGRLIQGEVHDETAFTLRQKMIAGNAGLFSTAGDLLTFLEMLLRKDVHYFSETTINNMQTNQLASIHKSASLGWELSRKDCMGTLCSPNTFGKTGFTGCLVVCDIPRQTGIVILSNAVHPHRPQNRTAIHKLRNDICDIVWKNL